MYKIGIIGFSNLYNAPIDFYVNLFLKKNINFDVIYWDRDCLDESADYNTIPFRLKLDNSENKIKKFLYMRRYSSYVKKVVKKNRYDFLIVSTTLLSFFLKDLLNDFKYKYLIDIRDYSYEHIKFYFKVIEKICLNAKIRVISSPDFKIFLPKCEYLICHNLNDLYLKQPCINSYKKKTEEVIEIGFIGIIRYKDQCLRLIDSIKNDNRFLLSFYGTGPDEKMLIQYVNDEKINNVLFHGRYNKNDKVKIIESVDVLSNLYGNNNNEVKYALSNKSYDAAYFKKIILVNENTTMEEFTSGFNFVVRDDESDFKDSLFQYFKNVDETEFDKSANKCLVNSIKDNYMLINELTNILR